MVKTFTSIPFHLPERSPTVTRSPSFPALGVLGTHSLSSYAERLTTRHIFYKWSHCAAFYSYLCELNRVLKANPRYSVYQHFFLLPNSILLHKYKLFHQSLDNWAVSMCQLPWIMLPRTSVNNVLCRHVYSRRLPQLQWSMMAKWEHVYTACRMWCSAVCLLRFILVCYWSSPWVCFCSFSFCLLLFVFPEYLPGACPLPCISICPIPY